MDEYFEKYFSTTKKKVKKDSKPKVIDELYKVPKKDRGLDMPHFIETEPNVTNQADILFLPDDDGYRYALVVVDAATRKTDAVPLKGKSASEVLKAFKIIYARKILKVPKLIEVDSGSEFKGEVAKWFKEKGTRIRVARTARHRQQGLVERRNQIIGTAIHKRQAAEELLTGEPATEWIDDLPKIIAAMNRKTKKQNFPKKMKKIPDNPVCEKGSDACNLLAQGTKVRVALDRPQGVQGERLHGKFRSGDIRWDPKERTIRVVILKPSMPPMYLLDGPYGPHKCELVAYTKNQLQVILPEEEYPESSIIKNIDKIQTFRIEKILSKKKVKGRWMLEIKWRGFKETTLEPRSTIAKDQPELVRKFEEKN